MKIDSDAIENVVATFLIDDLDISDELLEIAREKYNVEVNNKKKIKIVGEVNDFRRNG